MDTTSSTIAEHAPKAAVRAEARPLRSLRRSHRRIRSKRTRLQRILFGLFFSVLGAYALNALILSLFFPQGSTTAVESYGGTEVIRMDEIAVGYGPFEVAAAGYVNMAVDEDRFYISDVLHDDHAAWEHTAYSHESFHLIQRELVAEAAGGYPSYLNPLRSFFYYFQLLRLNADLAPLMPEPTDPLPFTGGLEGSADCYAQPRGTAENPAHYTGVYIQENICDPAQVWVVDQMAAGNWPEAPGEAAVLPELFVEGGFPSKSKPELIGKDGADKPIFRKAFKVIERSI